jgi:hypothetical protein
MEVEWFSSVPVSAFYAALVLLRGRTFVEPAIESALMPIARRLQTELSACGYRAEPVLWHMMALADHCDSDADLAQAALSKTVGREHNPNCRALVSTAAGELLVALQRARPRAAEELPLRVDPLRSQWEARGPGLLAGMRRLSSDDLLVPAASLTLVQPVLGGGGVAHPPYNCVTFEGLLANPIAQLPEVLRLGWLLGQLNFDLPALSEPLGSERLSVVGPLALVPVVLAAAEDIELAQYDPPHLRLALDSWLGASAAASALGIWWETYQATRPAWPVALVALDALLKQEVGA